MSFSRGARELGRHANVPERDDDCLDFLALRLACPLVLDDPDDDINDALQMRWLKHLAEFEVDDEATLTFFPDGPGIYYDDDTKVPRIDEMRIRIAFELEVLNEPSRPWAINMNEWYARARPPFLDKTVLFRAPVARRQDHSKHFPKAGSGTDADLRRDSKSRISYFQHWVNSSVLHGLVREAEGEFMDALLGAGTLRAAIGCAIQVGWVAGEPGKLLAIKWSTELIHAYPISRTEAKGLPLVRAAASDG